MVVTHPPDTNVWIECLRKRGNLAVKRRLARQSPHTIALRPIVTGELFHGAAVSDHPADRRSDVDALIKPYVVLPIDGPTADIYARVRADLGSRGVPIGLLDVWIAAVAFRYDLTVATHNIDHFDRIPGLKLEDWQVP
jgi:tRNA(fMet)-specific endonuclease VapC